MILKNVYASGWAATGAKGVLASTMMNAYSVADALVSDLSTFSPSETNEEVVMNPDPPHPEDPPREIQDGIKSGMVVGYDEWKAVDLEEVRRGKAVGKERERMGWEDMRRFLSNVRS